MCVSSCPYKKVYFNWQSGKAEKCTLCYPRIEAGLPTICSETCVGRIRYLGLVLYDADRVEEAASTPNERDLLDAQLSVFLDPHDPAIQAQARRDGVPEDWIEAARRSPVYALALKYRIALPLHPEYRTLPMVWYVPPLSPVMRTIEGQGAQSDPDDVFPAIDALRIPIQYLANLLAAGDETVIRRVLKRLAAMRSYMREKNLAGTGSADIAADVAMEPTELEDMYRLLAIARYQDRFVIPPAHAETAKRLMLQQGACGLNFPGGPGGCEIAGTGSRRASADGFHPVQAADTGSNGHMPAAEMPGKQEIPAGAGRTIRRILPMHRGEAPR
jgi:nitrate reductase beta subunit